MTDKELLELAAKAAGKTKARYVKFWNSMADPAEDGDGFDRLTCWNPLADDGDALRLAVKLKLSVWFEERESHQWTHIIWVSPVFEPCVGDVNAATRRAIVRAAAEIGRGIAQQTARADLPEDNYYKTMAEAEETGRAAAEIGRQMK